MDLGLLLVRVVVGALFIGHGTQKLFGWFDGGGIEGTGKYLESIGYKPGPTWAALGGTAEAAGGALLMAGFITPIACIGLIAMMVNAILAVHIANGPWATNGGYEYPLVLATVAAAFAFAGPGAFSLDAWIGLTPYGLVAGALTVVLGVAAGAGAVAARKIAPASSQATRRAA